MAILLVGQTECALCGKGIAEGQESVGFPTFVANELDPLYIFNSGAFHAACFWQHPLAKLAQARSAEARRKSPPATRRCWVCGRTINHPDDYVGLGHLTEDSAEPIHRFNYAQFHNACLRKWDKRREMCALIKEFRHSGKWKGPALDGILVEFGG